MPVFTRGGYVNGTVFCQDFAQCFLPHYDQSSNTAVVLEMYYLYIADVTLFLLFVSF
jgi:hypothetical protein